MHENLALEQPVEELDNLEKHARNLVKGRYVIKMMTMLAMVMKESSAFWHSCFRLSCGPRVGGNMKCNGCVAFDATDMVYYTGVNFFVNPKSQGSSRPR